MVSRRDALRTLAVGTSLALAGCSALEDGPDDDPPEQLGTDWSPESDEWRFPAADLRNTRSVSLSVANAPTAVWDGPKPKWTKRERLVAATTETVVVATDGEDETVVRAHAATDGTVRWRRTIAGQRDPRFGGLVDGTLFVALDGRELLALAAADGSVRWQTDFLSRLVETVPERFLFEHPDDERHRFWLVPVATPETLYVQSPYGVHGVAPADGTEQWRIHLADESRREVFEYPGGLAVGDDRVWTSYRGTRTQVLTVLDGGRRVLVRKDDRPYFSGVRPVVVALGDARSIVLGLDGVNGPSDALVSAAGEWGASDWTFAGFATGDENPIARPPATDDERLFAVQAHERDGDLELGVVALEHEFGNVEWTRRRTLGVRPESTVRLRELLALAHPAVAGDTLLVAVGVAPDASAPPTDATLFGFSTRTGEERWRHELDVAPSDVAVAGDRLYVAGEQGGLVALERST